MCIQMDTHSCVCYQQYTEISSTLFVVVVFCLSYFAYWHLMYAIINKYHYYYSVRNALWRTVRLSAAISTEFLSMRAQFQFILLWYAHVHSFRGGCRVALEHVYLSQKSNCPGHSECVCIKFAIGHRPSVLGLSHSARCRLTNFIARAQARCASETDVYWWYWFCTERI